MLVSWTKKKHKIGHGRNDESYWGNKWTGTLSFFPQAGKTTTTMYLVKKW